METRDLDFKMLGFRVLVPRCLSCSWTTVSVREGSSSCFRMAILFGGVELRLRRQNGFVLGVWGSRFPGFNGEEGFGLRFLG